MADGLGFVQRADVAYDRLLLKEVVHHFGEGQLPTLFAGAFRQLRPNGRLVIMTRCEALRAPNGRAASFPHKSQEKRQP